MKTYTAIRDNDWNRTTMAHSSSIKRIREWAAVNCGYVVGSKELLELRRKWRDSGGQPSVVINLDEVTN